LSISASAGYGSASASASCGVTSGSIQSSTESQFIETTGWGPDLEVVNLIRWDLQIPVAAATCELDFSYSSGLPNFIPSISFDFESEVFACTESAPPDAKPWIQFASARCVPNSGSPTISQGVFALNADGTITRLGFFTDSAFNPTGSGGEFSLSASSVALSDLVPNTASSATIDVEVDAFADQDGNMDPENGGQICWIDREIFYAKLGLSINSDGYTPRADFDFDGDIDADDLNEFNLKSCTIDSDCSSGLDIDDIITYQTLYALNSPEADMDGNSTIDIDDIVLFQTLYAYGC
jgi:hypothetical protein